MRRSALSLLMTALIALIAVPVAAQEDRGTCKMQLDSARIGRHLDLGMGRVHQFGAGGVFARCVGEATRLQSDSVAWYSELDRLDFLGSFHFRDSAMSLDADRARYTPGLERLEAWGNVRLVNKKSGSVLTGPNLTYYRAIPGERTVTELYASGRPLVEYRAVEDPESEPYLIRGDRVHLRGESQAWAGGAVTIDRSDFAAKGDSAILNTAVGEGFLIGHAEAAGADSAGYTIEGRRIAFRLTDDELSWVQAQEDGRATSGEWRIVGDTIEFNVANDVIQTASVWGSTTRAHAESEKHSMEADSLWIDTPDQKLRELLGFGAARATSRTDSLVTEPDWMAGDTVVARFDTTGTGKQVLVLLEARGHAQAFYYIYQDVNRLGPPAINYSRGERITARFKDEELDRVDIIDAGDGVYLEPSGRRQP